MKLQSATSSYLDFLRFLAALSVLMGHMAQDGFALHWLPLSYLSHTAVMVFFVLSGFIIHRSSSGGRRSAADYFVSRASRIYSVAVPAIGFSVGLALALKLLFPEMIEKVHSYKELQFADILACLTFMTESWPTYRDSGKGLTMNGPYWSLSYEVWYYVLFGLYLYATPKWRVLVIALACVVAGPAVLMLFPVWLLGAWYSARYEGLKLWALPAAVACFFLSWVPVAAITYFQWDEALKLMLGRNIPGFWRVDGSQKVITDHLIGLCVVLNIHSYRSLGPGVHALFVRWQPVLAGLAGFSFTLYLFHRPMTEIAGALIPRQMQTVPVALATALMILGTCWLMSFVTERQLPLWRRAVGWLVYRCRSSTARLETL